MTAHKRAQPDPADHAPADQSPFGAARVVVGLLLVLAGAVVLAVAMLPQLVPTFGADPFTFLIQDRTGAPEDGNGTLLTFGALVLPAGGFSLAYLSATSRTRLWIAGFCAVFFTLQTLLLAGAVLWITGTGLHAAALFALPRSFDTGVITSPLALLFSVAAAVIMFVLAKRTTFDAQSADYFAEGNTVVRVRPLPVVVHALWAVVALAVLAAVLYLPLALIERAALDPAAGTLPEGSSAPWPRYTDLDFADARAAYAVTVGILVGAIVSSLIKKVLYRTVLRGYIGAPVSAQTEDRWKGIQSFAHYPIAVAGGTATAAVLFLLPTNDYDEPDATAIAIFTSISIALLFLGLFLLSSVWKSGDDPLHESALQQGVVGDLHKTFAVPDRRKRTPKRPKRPRRNH